MLRKEIEEKFPFLSVVTYGGVEYVGIINNQDNLTTTMYIYTDLAEEDRSRFVELGEVWWWETFSYVRKWKDLDTCKLQ